jgi:hypothetical protein
MCIIGAAMVFTGYTSYGERTNMVKMGRLFIVISTFFILLTMLLSTEINKEVINPTVEN